MLPWLSMHSTAALYSRKASSASPASAASPAPPASGQKKRGGRTRKERSPTLAQRIQTVLSDEGAWWQAPLLGVLLLAAALMLYLMGTQQTEFIYALF